MRREWQKKESPQRNPSGIYQDILDINGEIRGPQPVGGGRWPRLTPEQTPCQDEGMSPYPKGNRDPAAWPPCSGYGFALNHISSLSIVMFTSTFQRSSRRIVDAPDCKASGTK